MNACSARGKNLSAAHAHRLAGRLAVWAVLCLLGACSSTPDLAPPPSLSASDRSDEGEETGPRVREPVDAVDVQVPAEAAIAGDVDDENVVAPQVKETGALTERVLRERRTAFDPYVLTAHKHNYILPFNFTNNINKGVYQRNDVALREGLEPVEVQFQISLKSRLNKDDLFFADDQVALGITIESWWQLYSSDLSSPFRETNYLPEIFYLVPLLWGPFGGNTAVITGLEHQSNGQVQGLSRSWNRIFAGLIYERGNFIASIRPWYRIPEKRKENPDDAEGDDNPDILDFMGHGELTFGWRKNEIEYASLFRGNTSTGKGAVKLGVTFPFFAKFRGFVQFFHGYGDSLIDYNHTQTRIGVGVSLTNLY